MCLSVNKAVAEHESVNEFMRARPINKLFTNDDVDDDVVEVSDDKIFISDVLALTTQYTRKVFRILALRERSLEQSLFYK